MNTGAVREAEKHTVFAARLTQRGHEIHSMDDLLMLYEKAYTENTLERITTLPHPTVQKFAVITVAVVGASRRFLSQITRHQNEVKFMSASLQYSNYDGKADFVIPYEILTASQDVQEMYMKSCQSDMDSYSELIQLGIGNDAAGYATPQGLRNILIISATPYQWKHMIGQRVCRRNTAETRIVMMKIWQELYELSPILFAPEQTGSFCQRDYCKEGKLSCGEPIYKLLSPSHILRLDYSALFTEGDNENTSD